MTPDPKETEAVKPEDKTYMVPDHSHDELYLVYHVRGGQGPNYFSCHHCGFIKVPALDESRALVRELVEALEKISIAKGSDFYGEALAGWLMNIARETLSRLKGVQF